MTNERHVQDVGSLFDFSETIPGLPSQMNPVQRAIGLLTTPDAIWPEIMTEAGGVKDALFPYTVMVGLVPMAVGAVLSTILGSVMMYLSGVGSNPMTFLLATLFEYVATLCVILVGGKLLELIAPSLNLKRSLVLSVRVMAYGATPAFLFHLIGWVPVLGWFAQLVGLWLSVRLMIRGGQIVLKKPIAHVSVVSTPEAAPEPELAVR